MRVGVDTAEAADTAASVPEAMQVSAAADAEVSLEALAATVERGLAEEPVLLPRDLTPPESQPDGMAGTDKSITHREVRLEDTFMVLARDRRVKRLPNSMPDHHGIPVAITLPKIDPALGLHANPLSSRAIMPERIGICARSAPSRV
jgi:hypothetical protein